jgi:hypothetical protein
MRLTLRKVATGWLVSSATGLARRHIVRIRFNPVAGWTYPRGSGAGKREHRVREADVRQATSVRRLVRQ